MSSSEYLPQEPILPAPITTIEQLEAEGIPRYVDTFDDLLPWMQAMRRADPLMLYRAYRYQIKDENRNGALQTCSVPDPRALYENGNVENMALTQATRLEIAETLYSEDRPCELIHPGNIGVCFKSDASSTIDLLNEAGFALHNEASVNEFRDTQLVKHTDSYQVANNAELIHRMTGLANDAFLQYRTVKNGSKVSVSFSNAPQESFGSTKSWYTDWGDKRVQWRYSRVSRHEPIAQFPNNLGTDFRQFGNFERYFRKYRPFFPDHMSSFMLKYAISAINTREILYGLFKVMRDRSVPAIIWRKEGGPIIWNNVPELDNQQSISNP